MIGSDPTLEEIRMHAAQGVTRATDECASEHFRAILDLVDGGSPNLDASERSTRVSASRRVERDHDRE